MTVIRSSSGSYMEKVKEQTQTNRIAAMGPCATICQPYSVPGGCTPCGSKCMMYCQGK